MFEEEKSLPLRLEAIPEPEPPLIKGPELNKGPREAKSDQTVSERSASKSASPVASVAEAILLGSIRD